MRGSMKGLVLSLLLLGIAGAMSWYTLQDIRATGQAVKLSPLKVRVVYDPGLGRE